MCAYLHKISVGLVFKCVYRIFFSFKFYYSSNGFYFILKGVGKETRLEGVAHIYCQVKFWSSLQY